MLCAGLQRDHAGVHVAPLFAEGIGEVELVLDGDEVLGGRSVGLDGLDFGERPWMRTPYFAASSRMFTVAAPSFQCEVAPVVVVEVLVERLPLRRSYWPVTGTSLPVGKTLS